MAREGIQDTGQPVVIALQGVEAPRVGQRCAGEPALDVNQRLGGQQPVDHEHAGHQAQIEVSGRGAGGMAALIDQLAQAEPLQQGEHHGQGAPVREQFAVECRLRGGRLAPARGPLGGLVSGANGMSLAWHGRTRLLGYHWASHPAPRALGCALAIIAGLACEIQTKSARQ
jgi:hypothetical protein